MQVTKEKLTQAFKLWEDKYRLNSSDFYTQEQAAEMSSETTAEMDAAYFMQLLKEIPE